MNPLLALLIGVVRTGAAIWLVTFANQIGAFDGSLFSNQPWWTGLISFVIGFLVIAFAAWSFAGFVHSVMDLGGSSIVEGEVLRVRAKSGLVGSFTSNDDEPDNFYVAVYAGVGKEVAAYRVRPKIYGSFYQGQIVKVDVTRRLGYVKGRVE
jgi:hypothetical protein